MNLWEIYLGYHPEILSRLDLMDGVSRAKFLRRMKNEKDKGNFSKMRPELRKYNVDLSLMFFCSVHGDDFGAFF